MRTIPLALSLVVAFSSCSGTDAAPPGVAPGAEEQPGPCVVPGLPQGILGIRATPAGLAVTLGSATGSSLHQFTGSGCGLVAARDAPVLAQSEAALEVDDQGRVYLVPGESTAPGVQSTMTPAGDRGVVQVDSDGSITALGMGARWVDWVTTSPDGNHVVVAGCGITPVMRRTPAGWEPTQTTSQLWGAGVVVANDGSAVGLDGTSLVRFVDATQVILGSALLDLGDGERPPQRLARCGGNVCGIFEGGVAVWSPSGELVQRVPWAAAGKLATEDLVEVTGHASGLYLLLRRTEAQRVIFVPPPAG